MNSVASNWIIFARDDLRMAHLAEDNGIWNQVCFHAQQCVEKLIKAAIAGNGGIPPQVHTLSDLLKRADQATLGLLAPLAADIRSLDRYYIPTRYPDALPGTLPHGLPSERDASAALAVAESVAAILVPSDDQP